MGRRLPVRARFLPGASPHQLKETRDELSDVAAEESDHPWLPGACQHPCTPENELEFSTEEDVCTKASEGKDEEERK